GFPTLHVPSLDCPLSNWYKQAPVPRTKFETEPKMAHPRRISTMVGATIAATFTALAPVPASAQAQTVEYVALGDSYASGLGTREYIDDGSGCSRSDHAYPSLLADEIGADLTFAACSGATTADLVSSQLGG